MAKVTIRILAEPVSLAAFQAMLDEALALADASDAFRNNLCALLDGGEVLAAVQGDALATEAGDLLLRVASSQAFADLLAAGRAIDRHGDGADV